MHVGVTELKKGGGIATGDMAGISKMLQPDDDPVMMPSFEMTLHSGATSFAKRPAHYWRRDGLPVEYLMPSINTVQALEQRIGALESRVDGQASSIGDLQSKAASIGGGWQALGDMLSSIRKDLDSLEFVTSASYAVEGSTMYVFIVYDAKDRIGAMKKIYKQFRSTEAAFPGTNFDKRLFHKDRVIPGHLSDTTLIFDRR